VRGVGEERPLVCHRRRALVSAGEYSSGMIRATFAAVPRRLPVLLAKLIVFTVIVASAMVAASVAAFFIAQAFLSGYRPTYSLSDTDVLRVVVGTGVYLTLIGLLGGAIGWIAGARLPTGAGAAFSTSLHTPGELAPWTGPTVMIAWVAGAHAIAAVLLHRRDA